MSSLMFEVGSKCDKILYGHAATVNAFKSTVDSTSPNNGAIVVNGGIGIQKSLHVGGGIYVSGNIQAPEPKQDNDVCTKQYVDKMFKDVYKYIEHLHRCPEGDILTSNKTS